MDQEFQDQVAKYQKIAEAVNAFSSPELQILAFEALTGTKSPTRIKPEQPAVGDTSEEQAQAVLKQEQNGEGSVRKKKAAKPVLSVDKTLNLRPSGKQAFKDFVAEKQPGTNDERNVVAVYYLKELLEVGNVPIGQIMACYKEAEWRMPGNPLNSLQVTASKNAWLDTQDRENIKLTPQGENTVKFDLPRAKKKA